MTNEAVSVAAFLAAIMLIIGAAIGSMFASAILYEKDTYDCTVKCPGNSHSIKFNQVCYCEVK